MSLRVVKLSIVLVENQKNMQKTGADTCVHCDDVTVFNFLQVPDASAQRMRLQGRIHRQELRNSGAIEEADMAVLKRLGGLAIGGFVRNS